MSQALLRTALTSALLFLASVRPAGATSITVAGSTLGCFGAGCGSFTLTPTSGSPYQLTFNGTSFSVLTTAAGDASLTLGSFDRGITNVGNPGPAPLEFSLQVTFTLPTGIGGSPATFTAVITGKSASPYDIVFDNSFQTFAYANASGSGSFSFAVSNNPTVNNNSSGTLLYGAIQNATFTAAFPPTTPVPEPATLFLLGTGLTALALGFRRRSKSKNDGKRQSVPRT